MGVQMPPVSRKHSAHPMVGADTKSELLGAPLSDGRRALAEGVAHDFKNLLAIVAGNLEVLEQRIGKKSALRRLVQAASHAVHRGALLAECLMDAMPEQRLNPAKTDANDVALDVADLLKLSVGHTIHVATCLCDELWPAYVDAGQFQMALLNVCLNARDAMRMGGKLLIETANVRVMNTALEEIPPGRWIMIKVADTGIGMDPSILESACLPFFTTKETGNGTGLGLNQVCNFVRQSGGHLRITSAPAEGTVVRAYLPAWSKARHEKQVTRDSGPPRCSASRGRGSTLSSRISEISYWPTQDYLSGRF
jgi:signal transduction histidine kinase